MAIKNKKLKKFLYGALISIIGGLLNWFIGDLGSISLILALTLYPIVGGTTYMLLDDILLP